MNLILTADDFGRSVEINRAVLRAHREGVLTAASLMVAGDAFEDAVRIARDTPTLTVGLHVVLVDGRAVLPPDRIGRLVDSRGFFPNAPARLGMRYYLNPRARREASLELDAQFTRFAETGLRLSHVDGHQHMHMHPAIFPLVAALACRYRAGGIRVANDELLFSLRHDRSHVLTKLLWAIAFGRMSRRCRSRVSDLPLAVADRVYGLMQSGNMREDYVIALLRRLGAQAGAPHPTATGRNDSSIGDLSGAVSPATRTRPSAEIYFHPTTGPRTDALGPNPEELATLLSPAVRRAVEENSLRLCAYPDLAHHPKLQNVQ